MWHTPLSLSVTEITSVSATFLISSISKNQLSESPSLSLSNGVSVKVNGTPWPKCLARLADDADQVMIIIYGLMPGRQYDLELAVIPGNDKLIGRIVTESVLGAYTISTSYCSSIVLRRLAGNRARSDSDSSSGKPQVGAFPPFTPESLAVDRSPSPPSSSPPPTPSGSLYASQILEDHIASLQLKLSQLQTENETLSNTLKSARRDSQKAQAAQRAEISSLKRAAQKHSAGDTRMKQKVRALEEAVKQAIKCREDVEAEYALVEAARIEQEVELADISQRFEQVYARAEEWRVRREKAEEEANSKVQGVKTELAAVEARLDRLRAKREKLEGCRIGGAEEEEDEGRGKEQDNSSLDASGPSSNGGLVGELEAKMRELLLERERIEADPYASEQQRSPSPISEETTADKLAADARALSSSSSHSPTRHARSSSHHSHSHGHSTRANAKRPAPPSSSHQHSHSYSHTHTHTHSRIAAAAAISSPGARTVAPTLPRNHSTRGTSSTSGKGSAAWKKSSPPPPSHPPTQAEKPALSLNAPLFEPASIKCKNNSRSGTG
jgi:hypothetical protein